MAFVPKSRRTKFELTLRILDLNNVPLVSGQSVVKWHLPASQAAEHRGRTNKVPIKDHRVNYEYEKTVPLRLTVGKDGMLQESLIHLEILQEYSATGRNERILLGKVKLNLAEYVDSGEALSPASPPKKDQSGAEEGADGITRRYLLQEAKINSTLKIGVHMRYLEGVRDYTPPPLRTAPVFGGIAGIISSSEPASSPANGHTNGDGNPLDPTSGPVPSLSATSREAGEMQDMYRRTLAAYWASQPGEMKADECIEDIFAGGDGWGKNGPPAHILHSAHGAGTGSATAQPNVDSDGHGHHHKHHNRQASDSPTARSPGFGSKSGHGLGQGSFSFGRKQKVYRKAPGEVDEFEVREDLKSWTVGERAYG